MNNALNQAIAAAEIIFYREMNPDNWRLQPININTGKFHGGDRNVMAIVSVIGNEKWSLLKSLRDANILDSYSFYKRLHEAISTVGSTTGKDFVSLRCSLPTDFWPSELGASVD